MSFAEYPFHAKQWPRMISHPEEYDGSEALSLSWDLGSVEEAEKKQVMRAWIAKLPTLQHLKRLRLWTHVTQPVFDAACTPAQLEVLQIKWSNVQNLGAITQLKQLRALAIGSSTRVQSIDPLASLPALQLLEIENFKSITDFSPLTRLKTLEELAVTGSMWSRQAIDSLEPFTTMTWLSSLAVDTSSVSDLRPLSKLTGLKSLGISGKLRFEEYAWLAGKLPNTECRWFMPYYELAGSGYSHCKTCKQDSMVMLTGKGKPILCKHCDAGKVEKHVAAFNAARVAAQNEA
jgi:hypothetical protein